MFDNIQTPVKTITVRKSNEEPPLLIQDQQPKLTMSPVFRKQKYESLLTSQNSPKLEKYNQKYNIPISYNLVRGTQARQSIQMYKDKDWNDMVLQNIKPDVNCIQKRNHQTVRAISQTSKTQTNFFATRENKRRADSVMSSLESKRERKSSQRNNLIGTLTTIDNFCNDNLDEVSVSNQMMKNVPKSILNRIEKTRQNPDGKSQFSMRNSPLAMLQQRSK